MNTSEIQIPKQEIRFLRQPEEIQAYYLKEYQTDGARIVCSINLNFDYIILDKTDIYKREMIVNLVIENKPMKTSIWIVEFTGIL